MENNMTTKLQIFNDKKVRTVWNADEEDWYFSVVDVVEILSESTQPNESLKPKEVSCPKKSDN